MDRAWRLIKYIVSGGAAACANLGVLYLCTEFLGVWYVWSATIAFSTGIVVSFSLHKFWTFSDPSTQLLYRQFSTYLTWTLAMLGLNTFLVFGLVEWLGAWYLIAQIVSGGCIACANYFFYKHAVFIV